MRAAHVAAEVHGMNVTDFIERHGTPDLTPEQHRIRQARRRDDLRIVEAKRLRTPVAAAEPAAELAAGRQLVLPGAVASPPPANRGGGLTPGLFESGISTRCHWLTVTFPAENLDAVRAHVSAVLRNQAEDRLKGYYGYECGCQWDEKGVLCWSPGRHEACLDLNGDTMDQMGLETQLELMKWLRGLAAEATRVDTAIDDYHREASLELIHAAADAGNFTGFKIHEARQPKTLSGEKLGDSHTFGRRGKEGALKYLRIYDKFLETGKHPDFDCIRWEIEHRKERADAVFKILCEAQNVEEYAVFCGQFTTEAIDFIDRDSVSAGSATHLSRLARLEWWERFLKRVAKGPRLTLARVVPTLVNAALALKRQYIKTFSLLDVQLQKVGSSAAALFQNWIDHNRHRADVDREGQRRDISVSLTLLCG
jgi:DNA relaxase NicK